MPLVVFSLLRLGLILAAGGLLYLAGARGWLLVLLATVVALPLSYLVLHRRRAAAAQWLAERSARRRSERARRTRDEDDEDAEVGRLSSPDGAAMDGGSPGPGR